MEYFYHVGAGAPNSYLVMLDKLQERVCRTVGPSLATSLEPLTHPRNVSSLSIFYRYSFGRSSSEPSKLVPLSYHRGCPLVILIGCMVFLSLFLDVIRVSISIVSLHARLDSGICNRKITSFDIWYKWLQVLKLNINILSIPKLLSPQCCQH